SSVAHRSRRADRFARLRLDIVGSRRSWGSDLLLVPLGLRPLRAWHAGAHRRPEAVGRSGAVPVHEKPDVCGGTYRRLGLGSALPGTAACAVRARRLGYGPFVHYLL